MEVSNLVREALRDFGTFKSEPEFHFPDLRKAAPGAELSAFAGNLDLRFVNVINQAGNESPLLYTLPIIHIPSNASGCSPLDTSSSNSWSPGRLRKKSSFF
jgi:hypothetical protein